ncbi:MAG: hypothetical protein IJU00_04055, partial [Selenomonas sp.]|nr:hypothetical protein [Selenomonas sp.]
HIHVFKIALLKMFGHVPLSLNVLCYLMTQLMRRFFSREMAACPGIPRIPPHLRIRYSFIGLGDIPSQML